MLNTSLADAWYVRVYEYNVYVLTLSLAAPSVYTGRTVRSTVCRVCIDPMDFGWVDDVLP